jgi:EAL domain-containing protein (putative c-di-GMP-specific phosphodiesterase class I)
VSTPPIDIRSLIRNGSVETYLQPIASVRRQGLIGVEALTRCTVDGVPIPPPLLFETAERAGMATELDHLCRRSAVQNFRGLHALDPRLVLFVNCHPATMGEAPHAMDGWASLADRFGIAPPNMAVEFAEADLGDAETVRNAARRLRDAGFLVALDDIGAKAANLDRIAYVKPDIIKADRQLVSGIDHDFHKREVFRSLVVMSERLGGWIIAEGVETEAEAVAVVELGGDMLQGYLFGRPYPAVPGEAVRWESERVFSAASRVKERRLRAARASRTRRDERVEVVRRIAAGLAECAPDEAEAALKHLIRPLPSVLSAALIEESGVQATETVLNPLRMLREKTVIFAPPARGADHSLKEYFYLLVEGDSDPFITSPYVPLASGDLAVTLSTRITHADGTARILAVHVRAESADAT